MSSSPPKTFAELIEGLYQCRKGVQKMDVEKAKQYLESYVSNEADWEKYVFFDADKYTRNLVDDGNQCEGERLFNLIVLCWNHGQGSSIHNHADAECLMKILDGSVREEVYEAPEGATQHEMVQVKDNTYIRDQVAHINDSMGLHRVSNPSFEKQTVTLHLYFPPFSECKVYDKSTGNQSVGQMTYYSKYGKKVNTDIKHTDTCCGGKSCCNIK